MSRNTAEYQRRWRETNPGAARRNRELNRARNAAYVRMAQRYPSLFAEVYDEIIEEHGIEPPGALDAAEVRP